MYDKSKKTWSQRLKISKTEKTPTATTTSVAISPTTQSSVGGGVVSSATIAHNASISHNQTQAQQYQQQATAMHLQAMQLQQLSDYHNSVGGGGGGGGGVNSGGSLHGYEYLPGGLSRSMKYAEPWIYGTVRGIPSRPYHHYHQAGPNYGHPHAAAIFATHPLAASEAVAVVICSCPEYLKGTKRDVKKASVCKKCKGSRLPLASIGGTVRLQASSSMMQQAAKLRTSATMRVVSTSKKSRPTILDPQKDPYDLMRRTRLLSPEPGVMGNGGNTSGSSSKDKSRNRGKSASPTRGRSRTRGQLPPPKKLSTNEEASSQDCWLVEDNDSILNGSSASSSGNMNNSRRSILRCNVNPYDLISIKSTQAMETTSTTTTNTSAQASTPKSAATRTAPPIPSSANRAKLSTSQNEFMPPNDDFNVEDAALYEEAPPFATSGTTSGNIAAINHASSQMSKAPKAVKTSRRYEQSKATTTTTNPEKGIAPTKETEIVGSNGGDTSANSKLNYTNVQAIAGQRISLGEHKTTKKSLIKQSEDGRSCESIIIVDEDDNIEGNIRRKGEACVNYKADGPQRNNMNHTSVSSSSSASQHGHQHNQPQPKRPPRIQKQQSNDAVDQAVENTESFSISRQNNSTYRAEVESPVTVLTVTPTQNIKSILKRPTSKNSENGESMHEENIAVRPASLSSSVGILNSARDPSGMPTPTHQRRSTGNTVKEPGSGSTALVAATSPTATAQFYIPLPQARKKVQFMVEDNIIHAVDNNASSNTKTGTDWHQHDSDVGIENEVVEEEQQEQHYSTDDDEVVVLRNATPMTPSAATPPGQILKSTSNYEYYNRKREQQKLLLQQHAQHKMASTTANPPVLPQGKYMKADVNAMPTPTTLAQAALLAKLQHDSDAVSCALSAMDTKINTTNSMDNKANNNHQQPATMNKSLLLSWNDNNNDNKDSVDTDADEHDFDASAVIPLTNAKADSLHYEDVIPVTKQQQRQQIAANNKKNNNSNRIMSDTSSKLLLAQCQASSQPSSPSPSSSSTATSTSATSAWPSSVSDSVSHVTPSDDAAADDDDVCNDNNDIVPKAEHVSASTVAGDYDDDAKKTTKKQKQQQQQHRLQAFVASDSSDQATQSRNPIRRSHSERQPCYNKLTNVGVSFRDDATTKDRNNTSDNDNESNNNNRNTNSNTNTNSGSSNNNNNNNGILNFKDTMALRIKNNRNDSRDVFARNSISTTTPTTSMGRPREPPPPPPPPPPPTTPSTCTAGGATTDATATTKVDTKEFTDATKSKANALSLSPAGQQQQTDADKDKNMADDEATIIAITTKTTAQVPANGLESQHQQHHHQQHQQQQQQQQQLREQQTTNAKNQRNLLNNGVSRQEINRANFVDNKDNTQQLTMRHIHGSQQQRQQQPLQATAIRTITSTSMHGNNGLSATNLSPQRTVVRVAPFNKTTSEVHRLKISHTDEDHHHSNNNSSRHSPTSAYNFRYSNANVSGGGGSTPNSPNLLLGVLGEDSSCDSSTQKRTSILINGDDCYSTMNLSCDASTPLYQSSVVVADYSTTANSNDQAATVATAAAAYAGLKVTTTSNTVTINVSSPRSAEEELIYQHNQINTMLSRQAKTTGGVTMGGGNIGRAIIPIRGTTTEVGLHRSASSTSSTSTSSMTSISSSGSGSIPKRGRTLIRLDYEKEKPQQYTRKEESIAEMAQTQTTTASTTKTRIPELLSHEEELLKILRNPVEAVKRNLVPHVCGRYDAKNDKDHVRNKKMKEISQNVEIGKNNSEPTDTAESSPSPEATLLRSKANKSSDRNTFIAKLLEDPTLSQVADGLETETVAELIENSLKRLKESRNAIDISDTKDSDHMNRLINLSLQKIKEERQVATPTTNAATTTSNSSAHTHLTVPTTKDEDRISNRGSISSANSFASANYEMFEFDPANESDCYQSCSSEITSPGDDDASSAATRSKFYQMLVDATLAEIEMSTNMDEIDEDVDEHHYESIRNNGDPIYEEITDMPPPLPLSAPPLNDADLEKKAARSIFEGASKYDILSYLVDAKERGVVREEPFEYPINCSNPIIIEEEACDTLSDLGKRKMKKDNMSSRSSVLSDSSEDTQSNMSSLSPPPNNFIYGGTSLLQRKGASSEIERNDSGVGSETSKSSRSKYQNPIGTNTTLLPIHSPIHLCEDCDGPVETQVTDSGVMFAPLVCRKCGKKRVERKEIITEIVETEEKYGRDLQIILEEFCHPMLVAGLLTQEQLSAIFLNTEELLENNQTLAERMRDGLDIALEQGDDDLLTVNIGKIVLDFTQMLHAFESYCVRQASASLLLANLEKEKELLRIFLKVSQMENAVLRRMNLNSFLMVPVQRVTKYPLLLARLYKVTPAHLEGRDLLKQAQEKIELHLNHINQEAKDVPTKLWRRISSSSPNRRASCEIDMINIKLRKMAIDILEWNHDEVRFAMEGKLLYTQPTDSNWKKARTIKLTPVNALLVTNGKPSANYKAEKVMSDKLNFPKHTGIREASLLVVKEKCGRYTLIREPLYLDRCVVCSEADWDDYFEVQEISSKDTFIFKAEDGVRTKQWYTQLQFHAQGMGAWRKRRNALANIMINGMLARS